MKASIVDLRYRMKSVLEALNRREEVLVVQRGKVKGRLVPERPAEKMSAANHPFFGSNKRDNKSVDEAMEELRANRGHAV